MQANLMGTLESEGFTWTPHAQDAIFGNPPVYLEQRDVQQPSIPRGHDSSALPEMTRAAYVPPPTAFHQGSTTQDFQSHRGAREQQVMASTISLVVLVGVLGFALLYRP